MLSIRNFDFVKYVLEKTIRKLKYRLNYSFKFTLRKVSFVKANVTTKNKQKRDKSGLILETLPFHYYPYLALALISVIISWKFFFILSKKQKSIDLFVIFVELINMRVL